MTRVAPPGPLPRDPTASARLLDAAAEVGLRVERLHRDVDAVERAVERLACAVAHPSRGGTGGAPDARRATRVPPAAGAVPATRVSAQARALAIDLAVGGASRASIREQIRERYGLLDADDLLDAVVRPGP